MCSGMVYNVTPYMDYHPGGEEELMRAAGIDGTDLFDQVWEEMFNVSTGNSRVYLCCVVCLCVCLGTGSPLGKL